MKYLWPHNNCLHALICLWYIMRVMACNAVVVTVSYYYKRPIKVSKISHMHKKWTVYDACISQKLHVESCADGNMVVLNTSTIRTDSWDKVNAAEVVCDLSLDILIPFFGMKYYHCWNLSNKLLWIQADCSHRPPRTSYKLFNRDTLRACRGMEFDTRSISNWCISTVSVLWAFLFI